MTKKNNKLNQTYLWLSLLLLILWCVYFSFFFKYYTDAIELVTLGAKKEIQLLELFYYRGSQTVILLISYFVLISVHILFVQYLKVQSIFELKPNRLMKVNLFLLLVIVMLSFLNSFWPMFVMLFIVSLTINYIVYTVTKTNYMYIDGDVIFEEKSIKTRAEAEAVLNENIKNRKDFFEKKDFVLSGIILEDTDMTYRVKLSVEEKV